MKQATYLRQCKAAAQNVASGLFGTHFDADAIEKVISYVATNFPRVYAGGADERGEAVLHREMAKTVKATLNADNDPGRGTSSAGAPCKTHQRLRKS